MSKWLAAAAAIAIVAVGVAWWWTQRGDEVETAVVTRGSIDVTIQTVGTIQATGASAVRPLVGGQIEMLGADAGDVVATGDIVAILDREPFEEALTSAQEALTQAEYALQLAESRSDASPDDQGLRLETLSAAQRVETAQRGVDDAKASLDSTVVVAPAAGTIIELMVRSGDTVTAQLPLARIAGPDAMQLVADVDELDLPNVVPGAAVTFRLDAYPERELTGAVRSTAAQARVQGGATVFSTTIDYEPQQGLDVRPGMNADVTIVTASRDDVLLIPERALRTVGERSFVTVRTSDGDRDREVILGYRSQGDVEVVDGLSEGDVVVLR